MSLKLLPDIRLLYTWKKVSNISTALVVYLTVNRGAIKNVMVHSSSQLKYALLEQESNNL